MGMLHVLLMIGVDPPLFLVLSLHRLSHFMLLGNISETSLHRPVLENLIPPVLFLLQTELPFRLLIVLLFGFKVYNLLVSDRIHSINLLFGEPLEVVGLHTVGGEHTHLSLLVLGHEVVVVSEVDLGLLLLFPDLVLVVVPVLLLLELDGVYSLAILLVFKSGSIVIALGLL